MNTIKTLTGTIILSILFASTVFAGSGQVVDVNPSGVIITIVDDADGEMKKVLNPGGKFQINLGQQISFESKNGNGQGIGSSQIDGVVNCPTINCQ